MSHIELSVPALLFVVFIVLLRIEHLLGDELDEFRTDMDPGESVPKQQSFWIPIDLKGSTNYAEEGKKYLRLMRIVTIIRLAVGVSIVVSLAFIN